MRANKRYGDLKKYIIKPILEKFGVPLSYQKYFIVYYIEGTADIIKEWLKNDCSDSVETMAAIIEECANVANGAGKRVYEE